jgi:hypothetical protein
MKFLFTKVLSLVIHVKLQQLSVIHKYRTKLGNTCITFAREISSNCNQTRL